MQPSGHALAERRRGKSDRESATTELVRTSSATLKSGLLATPSGAGEAGR